MLEVGTVRPATATVQLGFCCLGTVTIGGIHDVMVVRNVVKAAAVACTCSDKVIVRSLEGLETEGSRVKEVRRHLGSVSYCI